MKKTIIKLVVVIFLALGIVYGIFYAERLSVWKNFLDGYQKCENRQFIYESGLIILYEDEEDLKKLPLVESGDIELKLVKEDNELMKKLTEDLTNVIKKSDKAPKTKIDNNETIKYGFVDTDTNNYMYLYENGTALIFKNGNYYVYKFKGLDKVNNTFNKRDTGNTDIDPYFLIND